MSELPLFHVVAATLNGDAHEFDLRAAHPSGAVEIATELISARNRAAGTDHLGATHELEQVHVRRMPEPES